jgi:drug/metabolite transporter (DMT)-like permease
MLSGAARPTLVANTAPLWVGLGSLLIFRERQTVVFWVGLVVAVLGAMLVLRVDLSQGSELGLGTFLGLLAGVFYAGYHLVTQLGRVDLSALTYFWITTFGSAVVLLIVNFVFGHALTGYSVHTYLIFLITGVVVQLCGWLVINYAQGYLPASIVAPTLLAQPLLTVILAVLLLGETFSIWQIVGAGGVFAGVYLVHRSR